jgi:hypothetical protein
MFVPLTDEVMNISVIDEMTIPSEKITGPRDTNYHSDVRAMTLFMVSSLISDRYNYPELFQDNERSRKADDLISILWPSEEEIVKYRKDGIPFLNLPGIKNKKKKKKVRVQ